MKTAIICAMERESDALLGYTQNVRAEKRNGVEIYTGTISGKEVAVWEKPSRRRRPLCLSNAFRPKR